MSLIMLVKTKIPCPNCTHEIETSFHNPDFCPVWYLVRMGQLRRFFGLRGSFAWACRQMLLGRVVRPASASGSIKFRFDTEGQHRLQWSFERAHSPAKWENAFFFYADMLATDWIVVL